MAEPSNCTIIIEDAHGGNQLENASFDEGSFNDLFKGWKIHQSMAGTVSVNKSIVRTGGSSVALTKKKIPGTVSFSLAEPIKVEAGKSYLAAGYYHLENARHSSVFNFIVTISSPDKKDIRVEPMYTSTRIIYPMPISNSKSGWTRTFMNVNIPKDFVNAKVTMQIEVSGIPYTIFFGDMEFRLNPSPAPQYTNYLSAATNKPFYSKEETYSILQSKAPVKVELPQIGKTPLKINGQAVPMIAFSSIFSPEWPNQSAHKEYLKHGIKIHFIPTIAYSDNPIECTWVGEEKYNFKPLEEMLSKMLRFDPDACIMLGIDPTPYLELGDKHPEARWINAFGQYSVMEKEGWRAATKRKPGEYWNLSYTAEIIQKETSTYFEALGEFLKANVLGKAAVGIHISGGTDGQWFLRGWLNGFGKA